MCNLYWHCWACGCLVQDEPWVNKIGEYCVKVWPEGDDVRHCAEEDCEYVNDWDLAVKEREECNECNAEDRVIIQSIEPGGPEPVEETVVKEEDEESSWPEEEGEEGEEGEVSEDESGSDDEDQEI